MSVTDLTAMLSALGAVVISLLGHLQTRRRTREELRQIRASAEESAARVRGELLAQLEQALERMGKMQDALDAMEEANRALKRENARLRARLEALEEENRTLRAWLDSLKRENAALKTRLDEVERENAAMLRGVNRLVAQVRRHGLEPAWEPAETEKKAA